MNKKQIYFHTGLSKTGSTFLQNRIFPQLNGIQYIPTVKYRNVDKFIENSKSDKIIVSREFDQQFEMEVKKFASKYPNAHPIVVFREHGNWIKSQYKRFVKNGHAYDFKDFINLKNDQGRFKIQDLNFENKIKILNHYFENKPLVLLYEELKTNPEHYVQRVLDFTNTTLDWNSIDLSPEHVSYSDHSLKLVRKASEWLPFEKKLEIHRKPIGFLYNLYANMVRYTLLYSANFIPKSYLVKEKLVQNKDISEVREFCKKDWDFVRSYVDNQ